VTDSPIYQEPLENVACAVVTSVINKGVTDGIFCVPVTEDQAIIALVKIFTALYYAGYREFCAEHLYLPDNSTLEEYVQAIKELPSPTPSEIAQDLLNQFYLIDSDFDDEFGDTPPWKNNDDGEQQED
jgi:hypothetical protein